MCLLEISVAGEIVRPERWLCWISVAGEIVDPKDVCGTSGAPKMMCEVAPKFSKLGHGMLRLCM